MALSSQDQVQTKMMVFKKLTMSLSFQEVQVKGTMRSHNESCAYEEDKEIVRRTDHQVQSWIGKRSDQRIAIVRFGRKSVRSSAAPNHA